MVAEIVGQIREAAYEAEDIIDTYVADMIRRRKMNLLEKVVIEAMLDFNLSDAMLDFRLGLSCRGLKAKDFDATLLTIKNFEVLTLCKWTFENDPESYLAGGSNSCVVKGTKCTGMEHLKVIKFMGFSSRRDEISLAKCLIHMIKGKPPKIKTSDGNCLDAMFVE